MAQKSSRPQTRCKLEIGSNGRQVVVGQSLAQKQAVGFAACFAFRTECRVGGMRRQHGIRTAAVGGGQPSGFSMRSSDCSRPWRSRTGPGSGTCTVGRWPSTDCMRPRDLLKLGQLVLAHGQWEGCRLVPAAWIERSMQPNLATDVSDFRYGSQWWSGSARWHGQPVTWHTAFFWQCWATPVRTAGAGPCHRHHRWRVRQLTTAIAVNRLVQGVVDSVRE